MDTDEARRAEADNLRSLYRLMGAEDRARPDQVERSNWREAVSTVNPWPALIDVLGRLPQPAATIPRIAAAIARPPLPRAAWRIATSGLVALLLVGVGWALWRTRPSPPVASSGSASMHQPLTASPQAGARMVTAPDAAVLPVPLIETVPLPVAPGATSAAQSIAATPSPPAARRRGTGPIAASSRSLGATSRLTGRSSAFASTAPAPAGRTAVAQQDGAGAAKAPSSSDTTPAAITIEPTSRSDDAPTDQQLVRRAKRAAAIDAIRALRLR